MAFLFAGILAPEKIGEDSQALEKPAPAGRRFRLIVTTDSGT
jgi:hypothetical protein